MHFKQYASTLYTYTAIRLANQPARPCDACSRSNPPLVIDTKKIPMGRFGINELSIKL